MAALLFALSILFFLGAVGLGREGYRLEALIVFLASTVLFSSAAIVAVIKAEFAHRFPRTGVEKMVASYREHGGE